METYNALINVHARAGNWRWAMSIFDDMLRAAVSMQKIPCSSSMTYHEIYQSFKAYPI